MKTIDHESGNRLLNRRDALLGVMAGALICPVIRPAAAATPQQGPPGRGPLTPFLGNAQGSRIMAVYFDYHCPYCREMDPLLPVLAQRNPQLQILLKEFPVLEADSQVASRIALSAQLRGKYLQTHDRLMRYSGDYTGAVATQIAQWLKVDPGAFRKDMGDPRVEAELRINMSEAQVRGVQGTPGIVTAGAVHSGGLSLEELQAMVDALAHAGPARARS